MSGKLILFDFDGTLADSFAATLSVANSLAATYGYPQLDIRQAESLRSLGAREVIRQTKIPVRRLPCWIRRMKMELRLKIPEMKPPPGLEEALQTLRQAEHQLGIVTSNSLENLRLFLVQHDWNSWFDYLETGSTLFGKGRLIKRVLDRSGFSAAETFYVGDEERDIEAARSAGVQAVAVSWGYSQRSLLARGHPDHLVDTPAELTNIFL